MAHITKREFEDLMEGIGAQVTRIKELEETNANNIACHEQHVSDLQAKLDAVKKVITEQAEDDGLWFNATTAPEAYLQKELRRLHAIGDQDE